MAPIKVESLCCFIQARFYFSATPVKGKAALAHYDGVAKMMTAQGEVRAFIETTYDPCTDVCTVESVPELDISGLRPEDVLCAAMRRLNQQMLWQAQWEAEQDRRKESQQGDATSVS